MGSKQIIELSNIEIGFNEKKETIRFKNLGCHHFLEVIEESGIHKYFRAAKILFCLQTQHEGLKISIEGIPITEVEAKSFKNPRIL